MENVPVHASAPSHSGRGANAPHQGKFKKLKMKRLATIVGGVVAIALLTMGALSMYLSSTSANIDSSKYQALFLTNGQVYFGKLQALNSGYMKLTDIYYLQTQSTSSTNSDLQASDTKTAADVQLIKLGNEIHGPVDEMIISKDQILFFENLKKDSKVVESIASYLTTQKK